MNLIDKLNLQLKTMSLKVINYGQRTTIVLYTYNHLFGGIEGHIFFPESWLF